MITGRFDREVAVDKVERPRTGHVDECWQVDKRKIAAHGHEPIEPSKVDQPQVGKGQGPRGFDQAEPDEI